MLSHRNQLDVTRLRDKVIVVLDVIFATSSMIAAFAHGIRDCLPVDEVDDARAYLEDRDCVVAGEKNAVVPAGFAHFAPLKLLRHALAERTLVFSSTNGAPALTLAAAGPHVYAGALLNRRALCAHLIENHREQSVVLLCAGSAGGFCLEDFYGAGAYAAEMQRLGGRWLLTDSALVSVAAFHHYEATEALHGSRVGRWMRDLQLHDDLDYCAQLDLLNIVPRMHGERLLATRV